MNSRPDVTQQATFVTELVTSTSRSDSLCGGDSGRRDRGIAWLPLRGPPDLASLAGRPAWCQPGQRLLGWAAQFEERTWAVEGAGSLGYLLAQQLVAAREHVLDVQAKLVARVRPLPTATTNKNDPNDARSVAIVALRSPSPIEVHAEDNTAVMKLWAKRHRDLASHRAQMACRLRAVLCELVPGGYSGKVYVPRADKLLGELEPEGSVAGDGFGAEVAISDTTVIGGAFQHAEGAGRVYGFEV